MDEFTGSLSETFPLAGDLGSIALDERGVTHPRAPRGGPTVHTPYEEITHVAASPRAVWIGARRSVYLLPRALFAAEHQPDRLVRALCDRIGDLPNGDARLARMAGIDARGRAATNTPVTWALVGACLSVFVFQLLMSPTLIELGSYDARLVADGDWWRLFTANLLHAFPTFPLHLGLNLLGLIALGTLLERPLGPARTLLVMGVSGVAAMASAGVAGQGTVVGVSGVVFGLLGALTWLELRHGSELPAWWRVPRRAFWWMYAVSAALALLFPFLIAGEAHLGGVLGGAAAAALATRSFGSPAPRWVRLGAGSVVVLLVAALLAAAGELAQPGDYRVRLTLRRAELPQIPAVELNNRAWMIAIDDTSSPELLSAALRMAERAVEETQRNEPTLLDTLAELQFLLGRTPDALVSIEAAIELDPDETYYQEQHRRFRGERPDRPPAPGPADPERGAGSETEPRGDPGLEV
ncbi:MAG: rhomboid family intramembrane serine protease [Myxococcota bacterium]